MFCTTLFISMLLYFPVDMRTKRLLGPALIMAILLTSIPVAFSNGGLEPGYSPGYWKHQCKVAVTGRGHLHEPLIEAMAISIGFDSVEDALEAFTEGNNSDGYWTWLANEFNALKGLAPYEE